MTDTERVAAASVIVMSEPPRAQVVVMLVDATEAVIAARTVWATRMADGWACEVPASLFAAAAPGPGYRVQIVGIPE